MRKLGSKLRRTNELTKRGIGVWHNYVSFHYGHVTPWPIGYINLELTRRCNLKCRMCNIWQAYKDPYAERPEELDYDTWIKIFQESYYLKRMPKISITGGEPSLRKDFDRLISGFIGLPHVHLLSIATNGSITSTIMNSVTKSLSKIPKNKVLELCISVDGKGRLHDEIRGVPGTFKRVKSTIEGLCELRTQFPSLQLIGHATLQPENIEEINALREFFKNRNIRLSYSVVQDNTFLANKGAPSAASLFSQDQWRTIYSLTDNHPCHIGMRRYYESGGVRPLKCYAGYNSVFISSIGNVYPCVSKAHDPNFLMGSIVKTGFNFDNIWNSKRAWEIRSVTKKCNDCWNACEVLATRPQHFFGELGVKLASLGLLDYYKLRGMR